VLGQDIFGRDAKFERVEIDHTYPEYLRAHISEYEHLVMPRITVFSKLYHRFDITVGRFFRKAIRKIKRTIFRR
jgi:beta-1,4-mannosyl-glycoprotein beta-1,4-N-acetylglucosaminyltransferase